MQIALLGPLEVRTDAGTAVELSGPRLRTLLILLALEPGRIVTTARLVDGLWGTQPPAGAGNALQALVSRLRRAAPDLVVQVHPAGYRLDLPEDRVDVHRFARLVRHGRAVLADDPYRAGDILRQALALWRGPALADVAEADWAGAALARLAELRLSAIEDRIDADLRADGDRTRTDRVDHDQVEAELEQLVTEHPLRERLVGLQMRALAAAGRPGQSLEVYERTRRRLADQLGADPSAELSRLHLSVLRGPTGDGPTRERPTHAGPGPHERRTNLRAGLTSFIGRERELGQVAEVLRRARLTTLTGPGGSGKTRLAVESARAFVTDLPGGVWLIELAPVTDPGELAPTLIDTLGLREEALTGRNGRRPGLALATGESADQLDRLVGALAGQELLLVLDNCEHLIGAAATVADRILGECPRVRIVATSREPLGITGETLWPVEPLALPPADADADQALRYAAVQLLVERATAVRPEFTVDPRTAPAVVRICRALDGMPLAIELAAARLRAMPVQEVAARLDDRFRLLTGGSRTARPRHQTLRAVVDWSWELLTGPERALCRRLAVFAGGATLEAAERVGAGGPVDPADVVDLLTGLVDKSLVGLDGDRYRMLETIRAYGLDRLAEAGEAETLRAAHADYFLALAETADPLLRGPDQLTWLARLVEDHENLHAALRGAIAAGDAVTAVRLVGALGFYWFIRGHRMEGTELAEEAMAVPGPVPDAAVALAYAVGALNAFDSGRPLDQISDWCHRARAAASRTPEAQSIVLLVSPLVALINGGPGEQTEADLRPLFDDPDPWVAAAARMMTAAVVNNLGTRWADTEDLCAEALRRFRWLNERWGISLTLVLLADLHSRAGHHAVAAAEYAEAMTFFLELGTNEDLPQMQARYAGELFRLGEVDRATEILEDARWRAERSGLAEPRSVVYTALAEQARLRGDLAGARRWLGRTSELLERLFGGAPQWRALVASAWGYLALAEGDPAGAAAHHERAFRLAVDSHDHPVIGDVLVGLADLALSTGDSERAAELLGASEAISGTVESGTVDGPRVYGATRAALGDAEFARAHQRGRQLTITTIPAAITPGA